MPNTLLHDEKPSFNNTRPAESDYTRLYAHEGHEVGMCSVTFARPRQEDYLSAGIEEITEFKQLTREQQTLVLRETYCQAQDSYGQVEKAGTTVCFAAAWLDEKNIYHVTTANLGDSHAILVILDKNNEVIYAERLHALHKPSDLNEIERIRLSNGIVTFMHNMHRLNGVLALSRALGDTLYEVEGLSYVPAINFFARELKDGEKPVVIVASDGIDPLITLSHDASILPRQIEDSAVPYIGNVIKEAHDLPLHLIAEKIVEGACQFDSKDNLSALAFNQGSGLVCDGHGGDTVSEPVSKNFYNILQTESKKCLADVNYVGELKQKFEQIDSWENERLRNEQNRISTKLALIKAKLETAAQEIKCSDECTASVSEVVIDEMVPPSPWGYELTIATNVQEIKQELQKLANQYELTVSCDDQLKIAANLNPTIPAELDAFINDVVSFLEQRKKCNDAAAVTSDASNQVNNQHAFFTPIGVSTMNSSATTTKPTSPTHTL